MDMTDLGKPGATGAFVKIETQKETWIADDGKEYSVDKTVRTQTGTFNFNDPEIDSRGIRNGIITRVEVMSDAKVNYLILRSGVTFVKPEDGLGFAWNEGAKKMDYGIQGINSGHLKKNTFYLRDNVAYNVGDIGNYLFGRGAAELGIPYGKVQIGSNLNNMLNGRRQTTSDYDFGPGTYGSPGVLDSEADQRAISAGFYSTPKGKQNDLREIYNQPTFNPK
jgi:hypothetical protein